MGCGSSKQSQCNKHSHSTYSPHPRSYSMPVRHPTHRKGDNYHVVAFTSATLGSLKLDSLDQSQLNGRTDDYHDDQMKKNIIHTKGKEFPMEIIQSKTWSNMINEKIPKTPTSTPPGEPETINTWELMEGLEDNSPTHLPILADRCFSFHTIPDSTSLDQSKPLWIQMAANDSSSNSNSIISDFDPEIISSFRKALEELSPSNSIHLRSPENEKIASPSNNRFLSRDLMPNKVNGVITASKCPPRGEDSVVIYFTSLRGVRKTYEDCCHVRVILKGFGVRVDERDVSMHYGFREELKELLGGGFIGGLPRVFVEGRYIGGADEVRQMNEDEDLQKVLEGCEVVEKGSGGGVCELCGDVRFVPCERCSGSCKIYHEEGGKDGREGGGGFQRCPDCNENGILRCPVCRY